MNLVGTGMPYTEFLSIFPYSVRSLYADCSSTLMILPIPMRKGFPLLFNASDGSLNSLTDELMSPKE